MEPGVILDLERKIGKDVPSRTAQAPANTPNAINRQVARRKVRGRAASILSTAAPLEASNRKTLIGGA